MSDTDRSAGALPRDEETETQVKVRLPGYLKSLLEEAAEKNGTSVNAEVVHRLSASFSSAVSGFTALLLARAQLSYALDIIRAEERLAREAITILSKLAPDALEVQELMRRRLEMRFDREPPPDELTAMRQHFMKGEKGAGSTDTPE